MQEPYDGRDSTSNDRPVLPSASVTDVIHPEFYFDSVYVVFKVENVLFRVSSRLLVKESPKFGELFGLTQQDSDGRGGGSGDRGPIAIPDDIKSTDFCCLLKVLYPTSALIDPVTQLSKDEWISVLCLSTLWSFLALRAKAITQLAATLSPLEKIMLGRRFFVSAWVLSGYETIVSRSETVSDEEAEKIGYQTSFKLYRIRESRIRPNTQPQPQGFYYVVPPARMPVVERISIEDTFKDEISSIRTKEPEFKAPVQHDLDETHFNDLSKSATPTFPARR